MSVSLQLHLTDSGLSGSWWNEDNPSTKLEVRGSMLDEAAVRERHACVRGEGVAGERVLLLQRPRPAIPSGRGPLANASRPVFPFRALFSTCGSCAAPFPAPQLPRLPAQARRAIAAELCSQDNSLLLGVRPLAHRSASRREADAIVQTLRVGPPGLAEKSLSRVTPVSTAAPAPRFPPSAGTAAAAVVSSSSDSEGPPARVGSLAAQAQAQAGAGAGAAGGLSCSAWAVQFAMPAPADEEAAAAGSGELVAECLALAIVPPEGWLGGSRRPGAVGLAAAAGGARLAPGPGGARTAGMGGLEAPSGVRFAVHGQGFNAFGAFVLDGDYDPVTGAIAAEKTYTARRDYEQEATLKAWGEAGAAVGRLAAAGEAAGAAGSSSGAAAAAASTAGATAGGAQREAADASSAPKETARRAAKRRRAVAAAAEGADSGEDEEGPAGASALRRTMAAPGSAKRTRSDPTRAAPRAADAARTAAAGAAPLSGEWARPGALGEQAGPLAGALYEGETVDGRPQGRGAAVFSNGFMYEGQFEDGAEHGWGVVSDAGDRIVFEGTFDRGSVTGFGRARLQCGDEYEGQFERGLFHGVGRYCMAGGGMYDGAWREGERHGEGTQVEADGTTYIGQWRAGARCGQGRMRAADGSEYSGSWKDGAFDGEGALVLADGTQYKGAFAGGQFQGQGTMTFAGGIASIAGRFAAGLPAGTVVLRQTQPVSVRHGVWAAPQQCTE